MIKTVIRYLDGDGFEFSFEPIEDTLTIKKTKTGYEARYLIYEESPESPREWDNLSRMICFHNRYSLGDKTELKAGDFDGWEGLKSYLVKEESAAAILPLYLYDHSGIKISTGPFSCPWDSGQVGFVYVTRDQLKREGLTKAKAREVIMAEVETYDEYLKGDVYCLVKETYGKDKKPVDYDTLGGCFGRDWAEKALKTEI